MSLELVPIVDSHRLFASMGFNSCVLSNVGRFQSGKDTLRSVPSSVVSLVKRSVHHPGSSLVVFSSVVLAVGT